ncbi:LEAF RUST 10 DISEASE-RESISTANCE LOCUS RECEPTOR-LIKE PROTEIN KINASE-like 1.2 isoform X1 [Gastrolobium bilobum]|uniref:LEAF RUST 10 DISEASE-RESISTANCE LOCUS RECEPTOR-LIKE PROTEIN KINASE-like 1.2 isoform X1 n=1 Tax=Gastrolobium bilobum TaxID=150636 RepID=UPI002AAFAA1B|nr:LEAF RUST 10 DISEASE-RESISTANCE LOCUS RECEPTOR-LIKE PROTEIN KINASE-like 1.2 isoform X1 [Gastrolobium bilobum]
MNKKFLFFVLKPLIHSYIFLFYIQIRTTSCSPDPKFETCQPKTCGNNLTISYPFYILGIQEPFCGYPGFGLSCAKNGFPILNLSNTQYIIDQIFYDNRSLRVSNAVFSISTSNTTKGCLPPTQNLTLANNVFHLAPNQKDMILFFGCDLQSLPTGLQEHRIGCSAENETSSVVALYKDDKNLSFASENCKGEVVDAIVEDGYGGIEEALRKGFWLNWTASDCSLCRSTGGRCGFDSDIYTFRCYCTDRVHASDCGPATAKPKRLRRNVKLCIGLGVGILGILIIGLLLLFLLYKRKHATSGGHLQSGNSYSDSSLNPRSESGSVYFGVPLFSYEKLKEATNNFDHTRELGDGGFGTVYYGKLPDGREVAVKRLYEHNYRRVQQFINEVEILTRLRHKNLVSLYGCTSRHSRELLLVYEYISNGTVACHLHGGLAKSGLLPGSLRIKIAIETASALAYLHASGIIHRDVKTSNILLDSSFCVKVADFGLSRLFPDDVTHVSTAPQGTPGYVDPEYHQCYQLTNKSDVYSFGVVLIELISSKPAVDINRSKDEINLSNLAVKKIQESAIGELVDPSIGFDSDQDVKRMMVSVAELAFQCLQRDKELRPSMQEVLDELCRIESGKDEVALQEEADVHGVGVSHSNVHPPLLASPDSDEVGLLKNMKLPTSPNTVTDKWESERTTPNVSG